MPNDGTHERNAKNVEDHTEDQHDPRQRFQWSEDREYHYTKLPEVPRVYPWKRSTPLEVDQQLIWYWNCLESSLEQKMINKYENIRNHEAEYGISHKKEYQNQNQHILCV